MMIGVWLFGQSECKRRPCGHARVLQCAHPRLMLRHRTLSEHLRSQGRCFVRFRLQIGHPLRSTRSVFERWSRRVDESVSTAADGLAAVRTRTALHGAATVADDVDVTLTAFEPVGGAAVYSTQHCTLLLQPLFTLRRRHGGALHHQPLQLHLDGHAATVLDRLNIVDHSIENLAAHDNPISITHTNTLSLAE